MKDFIHTAAGTIRPGMRLGIIKIDDPFTRADYPGKEGIVTMIDDIGQIHGTWGGLALVPELDDFTILPDKDYYGG